MKYFKYLILVGLGFAVMGNAQPNEACRFHMKNCKDNGLSREECRKSMPEDCRKQMETRHEKFRGGKFPGSPPAFFEKCKNTPQCEGMGPGPEHINCLKKNGSAECKAALNETRKHMPEGGPGF